MPEIENRTVTLCEKIKLSNIELPVNNWSEFHKIFDIIQKETILASNKIISVCNVYNSFTTKKEAGDWLLATYNKDKIRNVLYDVSRNFSRLTYSRNSNAASNDINAKYFSGLNSYKNKIDKGIGNAPMTFTDSIPLFLASQGYRIECTDLNKGYYSIQLPFLNMNWKNGITSSFAEKTKDGKFDIKEKPLNLLGSHIRFGINAGNNPQLKAILDNIISGNYKFGDSKLKRVKSTKKRHKYDYYFLLSYTKPVDKNDDLLEENVLGVDVGMAVPAYCAVNYCDYRRNAIGDSSIIRLNKAQENINRKIQKSIKYNMKDGHGRKHKLDGYDGSHNKIANRNSTYNFNIAKEIIDNAVKWKCGTIHLEKLTGFHASNVNDRFLGSWTYFDLQQKIENKAKEKGIKIKYINPYHTSQTCSRCGNWEVGQRTSQAVFECKECGYKVNADYNAARDIAMSTKFVK